MLHLAFSIRLGKQCYSFNLCECKGVLDSARTFNGSNEIFLSLHMLQTVEDVLPEQELF